MLLTDRVRVHPDFQVVILSRNIGKKVEISLHTNIIVYIYCIRKIERIGMHTYCCFNFKYNLTSEASCTNVVDVNVLVALGPPTADDEAELVKEIVDPDGIAVGNPGTIPIN